MDKATPTMQATASHIPAIGVHKGVSFPTYQRWEAVNQSLLTNFAASALHARQAMIEPQEETSALMVGHATHAAIFEPDVFTKQYAAAPKVDRRTKAGKEEYAAFENDNRDKIIIPADEMATCLKMLESAIKHPIARAMLYGKGHNELSIAWDDADTKLRCKARIDRLTSYTGWPTIVDLKHTREIPTRRNVERVIAKYFYHCQAGFYSHGLNVLAPADRQYVLIFIENQPPYDVACYRLNEAAIAAGLQQVKTYLQRYADCKASGIWPGVSDALQEASLPDWAMQAADAG